jgi:hypothetical protein
MGVAMRAAVMTVQIADLPRVKATLDEARRRLREQEDTIQRLIAQADENGRQIAELRAQLAGRPAGANRFRVDL